MLFLPSLSTEDLHHYHRVVTHSVEVRSHFDVLIWLQGDMQRYLPHDILIAAWGDFSSGAVQHDVISAMAGVRSHVSHAPAITPLLVTLFNRWAEFGNKPFSLNAGESGFLLNDSGLKSALGGALQKMRSATVHGIRDERGSHDCLYVAFSVKDIFTEVERGAMSMVLPYIDTALRQVEHLPHQAQLQSQASAKNGLLSIEHDLTDREAEILKWVALGKTNPEIGSILEISTFTVKNHMQRVFKKLDVSNRAQAVGKFRAWVNHA
ncbi:XrtB/PEP-CTERM-associated transcriptional regulator EpsA [Rhodoferax saidenbachensis]|uniref:Transcriptional regulator EpsA n=1 Tax=Rhodoferax saidenbachensis TaxID=1484693 RepID=A0ABU1ZJ88_9BURK|nr:XrtB/PEP-CTERM-associated transcriptional regulator EpsA [Rhodoferax saidenbachensis]MDR7305612.1 transcriptional regulator EpsA [Rhodoferax saidenbachensis]